MMLESLLAEKSRQLGDGSQSQSPCFRDLAVAIYH